MRRSKNNQAYKKRLWKVFSLYIRLRDADKFGYTKCISCGVKKHFKELDAGHYLPKTRGNAMYFNEKNVHPQCTYCNRYLHGNQNRYALALIERYGSEILKKLEYESRKIVSISELEYLKLIEYYKNKIDELQNLW